MKRIIPLLTFLQLAAWTFIPTISVRADTGPHPTMDFELVWAIPRVSVSDAALYTCGDAACADPVKVIGPFSCSEQSCRYNYGGSGFYKLIIVFADKTRQSNIFEKRGFEASFTVQVNADNLSIEQIGLGLPYALSTQVMGFLVALVITLSIEIPLAVLMLKRWNLPRKWLLILVANLISLPIVWFVFPFISNNTFIVIGLAELFAIAFEACFYYLAMRKDGLGLGRAATLSALANFASVAIPFLCAIAYLAILYN
jgi:hypothetical protein